MLFYQSKGVSMPPASKATTVIKTVSPSGQISLGKKYAGKTVIIEQPEEGEWHIKTGATIPENELWLHTPEMKERLKEFFEWSENREPQTTSIEEIEAMVTKELERRERLVSK
jgi:hypothetical protein